MMPKRTGIHSTLVIGVSLMILSGCSAKPEAADCATRFADVSKMFPTVTSGIDASYVFDAGNRGADQKLLKNAAPVEAVQGNGQARIAEFERRDFHGAPSILLADGKSLIGIGKPVKDTADAVTQGCALEPKYGTLRNIRVTAVNPIISTKSQQ
jgi:hypothetical protein